MSGQLGPRHGVYTIGNSDRGNAKDRKLVPIKKVKHLEMDNLTLAGALQAGGYRTIHLGKWHVGNNPLLQGIDVNIGGDASGSPGGGYFSPFKKGFLMPYNNLYSAGTHRGDIFADQAIQFLRANTDKPFFMHRQKAQNDPVLDSQLITSALHSLTPIDEFCIVGGEPLV